MQDWSHALLVSERQNEKLGKVLKPRYIGVSVDFKNEGDFSLFRIFIVVLAGTVNRRAGSGNGEVWAVSGETTRGPSESLRLPRWMPPVVVCRLTSLQV